MTLANLPQSGPLGVAADRYSVPGVEKISYGE